MDDPKVLHLNEIETVDRGTGVKTIPLVGKWNTEGSVITSGITVFQPGTAIPLHTHNVEETIIILEGDATVIIGDNEYQLTAEDVTWAPAGVPHRFINRGAGIMRIYWVYGGRNVLRTIMATGETVEHLSAKDRTAVRA
jgi:quercetin dioxygenase-like cupin family protein